MPERLNMPSERPEMAGDRGTVPPSDVIDFIRYCYRRRRVGWPEIYDEMCAVAARREFNGWGHEQLAERGVTFTLPEMARLSAWVRAVLATQYEPIEVVAPQPAAT
jgi:hypothetical protein